MDHQYPTVAKIPVLDTGKFEQWQFQIQQYLQHENYALWEVIEFGDSYKVPATDPNDMTTTSGDDAKSGRTVTITIEDMQRKKNDVKARTILLLSLLDEHQLRFSKYKTAKELWAPILKTFGGNEATKKRKKNLLKHQYGNFKAKGSETLEQTFNRLQVIVSQLQLMDVEVEKYDLNQKFLTSLSPEWLMHTIVWRNRSDLDTMSLDDLYNHLKHSSGNEDGNTACVSTASTNVSTASASVATISQETASAYIASQSIGSQIKFEDINQINEDDMEEIDIKWSMALLSMRADKFWNKTGNKISIQGLNVAGFNKSKVDCFNCHKMGHFARECRAPRSQERGRKENYRQGSKAEEKTPKALMAIDRVGWDWSYMANERGDHALVADTEAPIEFALMANTESKRSDKVKDGVCYNVVPPPVADIYLSSKKDLSWTGLPEFTDDTVSDYSRPSPNVESTLEEGQNKNSSTYEGVASPITNKPFIKFVKPKDCQSESKTNKNETPKKPPVKYAEQYRKSNKTPNMRGNQRNWNNLKSYQLGPEFFLKKKACFNCGDFTHLDNDCRKRVKKGTTRTEDESSGILRKFITEIENLKDLKVKIIRVLVNKAHNKTPYELFNGRTPAIGFLKPFGCHVMILYTLDNLGKFEAKGDEGYFLRYSMSSKAFRVLNKRTKRVEENIHIEFLENKAIEKVPTVCFTDSQEPLSETRLISKRVTNQAEIPSLDNILTLTNQFEDILGDTSNSEESNRVEADVRNIEINITAIPTPTLRIHRDPPKNQIIGLVDTPIQTRNKSKEVGEQSFIATIHQKTDLALLQFCLFSCFLSQVEPKKIFDALQDPRWVEAVPIGTKWVLKNKKDERGIVIRIKARLVAQGHTQEKGIDYDEVFSSVARIKAIRLFLAYALFMGFIVYQMDMKSAFLYGTIDEEVFVMQPLGF
nr:retrovirus-related Pol polyprotein from transposon TNT 1-94 [Tanacetum cinerariifolium]